jgi:hypothetical protein
MNNERHLSTYFPNLMIQRPLSFVTGVVASLVILAALSLRLAGNMYLEQLNWIDAFTPVMIGILLLRALYTMRDDTDLQAVSIALIGALSFIFIYEAIYKISFYGFPWLMPPSELRDFLIQSGTALTVLVGFAFGKLKLSKTSLIFLGLFVVLYVFWILVGFPQVETGKNAFYAVINIPFTWNMIYAVNRGTKVLMFLAYFFFYSNPPKDEIFLAQAAIAAKKPVVDD